MEEPQNQTGDLHVTVIVTRDDALRVPVEYVRDRVAFTSDTEAADYAARVRNWVRDRPRAELVGVPLSPWPTPEREAFDENKIDEILDLARWPA